MRYIRYYRHSFDFKFLITHVAIEVPYDREYTLLYNDLPLGVTTAIHLWNETRKKNCAIEVLEEKKLIQYVIAVSHIPLGKNLTRRMQLFYNL